MSGCEPNEERILFQTYFSKYLNLSNNTSLIFNKTIPADFQVACLQANSGVAKIRFWMIPTCPFVSFSQNFIFQLFSSSTAVDDQTSADTLPFIQCLIVTSCSDVCLGIS